MPNYFIFVSTHRVREGKLAELVELGDKFIDFVAASEPNTIGFELFTDGAELTHIVIQPDAVAMDTHMQVSRDMIGAALELTETTGIDVYGTAGPVLGQVLRLNADAGVPVRIHTPLGAASGATAA